MQRKYYRTTCIKSVKLENWIDENCEDGIQVIKNKVIKKHQCETGAFSRTTACAAAARRHICESLKQLKTRKSIGMWEYFGFPIDRFISGLDWQLASSNTTTIHSHSPNSIRSGQLD